jgi:hypothetical protein
LGTLGYAVATMIGFLFMPQPASSTPPTVPGKKMNPQLKIMGWMALLFFGGIILYSILPEGPVRGMTVGIITVLSILCLFKGA